jgi:diguanylate cyclase (GGDEF)-like protein
MDRAAAAIAQARRARQPAVIAVFDLDHFKAVNDTYGHDAGDFLLTTLVSVLQRELRDGDLIGRLGGDEFVALVFGSDMAQAAAAIDRVIAKIKTEIAPLAGGNGAGCSCGMAPVAHSGEPVTAVTQAVGLADAALYEAKRTGRDRIVLSNATLPDHQHQAAEGAASS